VWIFSDYFMGLEFGFTFYRKPLVFNAKDYSV
jgi:hypothetical protein